MNIDKNMLKQSALSMIPRKHFHEKLERRIETIVRSCINHLRYDLYCGALNGKTSIYLQDKQTERIIIIERGPDTSKGPMTYIKNECFGYIMGYPYQCAVNVAQVIIEKVKGDLAKEKAAENHDAATSVCAD